MFSKIKDFFHENLMVPETIENEKYSKNKLAIATCALLLEIAYTDDEFSEIEEDVIKRIIQSQFELSEQKIDEIINLSNEARKESLDLWHFTNLINENFSMEEKIQVVENIWQVVFADNNVNKYEESLVRKLVYLLKVDHKDMIEAKLKVKHGKKKEN